MRIRAKARQEGGAILRILATQYGAVSLRHTVGFTVSQLPGSLFPESTSKKLSVPYLLQKFHYSPTVEDTDDLAAYLLARTIAVAGQRHLLMPTGVCQC